MRRLGGLLFSSFHLTTLFSLPVENKTKQQAEYDAMLIEYAGETIPALAVAAGGETFAPYFAGFLPLLLSKMVSPGMPNLFSPAPLPTFLLPPR